MKVITKKSFFQINNVFTLKKYLGSCLITLCLASCSLGDKAMDKVGFKVINPFYNDSNAANKKYDRNFSNRSRRTPEGNMVYLAADTNVPNKYDLILRDSEKYDNAQIDNFWKKVYKSKPANHTAYPTSLGKNKIEPVNVKELPRFESLENSKKPLFDAPGTMIEPQEIILNNEDEKILDEISFLKNNSSETSVKESSKSDVKSENIIVKPKKQKYKEYKHQPKVESNH
ncbi:MAG: hypothetical protein BGO27_03970 [Alphaproteobacteria bacterium 33-17]|nr:MAG: hypothetical protein BGO27_03970 [Alphaproteobacteria bacterium 33-17]